MTKIIYYTSVNGESPPRRFIEFLTEKQQRKVTRILSYIEEYGLITVIPHVKKLSGTPLWEIRILGQDNIRVFYAIVLSDSIFADSWIYKKIPANTPERNSKSFELFKRLV